MLIDWVVWLYTIYCRWIKTLWAKKEVDTIYGIQLSPTQCKVSKYFTDPSLYMIHYQRASSYYQFTSKKRDPKFSLSNCKLMSAFISKDVPIDISIQQFLIEPNVLFTPYFNQWLCYHLSIPYDTNMVVHIFDSKANQHIVDAQTRMIVNKQSISLERKGKITYIERK